MGNKHSNTGYNGGHATGTHSTASSAGTTGTGYDQTTGTTAAGHGHHGHHTAGTTSTTHHDTRHSGGKKKGALLASTLFWTLLNFLIFASICGLVGHLFNSWSNGNVTSTAAFTNPTGLALLFFSLLAGAVGLATMIMAAIHGAHQTDGAKHGTLGANLISLALTAIAFCFACKAIHTGLARGSGNNIKKELIALAALDIIAMATLLFYLMQLGLFRSHRHHEERLPTHYENRGTTYNNGTTGTTATQPKSVEMHQAPVGTTHTTGQERAYHA